MLLPTPLTQRVTCWNWNPKCACCTCKNQGSTRSRKNTSHLTPFNQTLHYPKPVTNTRAELTLNEYNFTYSNWLTQLSNVFKYPVTNQWSDSRFCHVTKSFHSSSVLGSDDRRGRLGVVALDQDFCCDNYFLVGPYIWQLDNHGFSDF